MRPQPVDRLATAEARSVSTLSTMHCGCDQVYPLTAFQFRLVRCSLSSHLPQQQLAPSSCCTRACDFKRFIPRLFLQHTLPTPDHVSRAPVSPKSTHETGHITRHLTLLPWNAQCAGAAYTKHRHPFSILLPATVAEFEQRA